MNNSNGSISFAGLLTLLFIALKLFGKISWSWWWVLAPMWISGLFLVSVSLFLVIIL
jgi:hypothetical protein